MKIRRKGALSIIGCVVSTLVAIHVLALFSSAEITMEEPQTTEPRIQLTLIPPKGGGPDRLDRIAGNASGVDVTRWRVVIFALGGNIWYVQPYTASPFTAIASDGKWENDTHLGSEYAALLVRPTYKPPDTTVALPQVGGEVLAIARVRAKAASAPDASPALSTSRATKTIQFSGYEWQVKSSSARVGPGPNYFSDDANNVEVDARGRLHVRITQRDGRWYCAEVISMRSFGYGTYRFYVDTNVDSLDAKVVLGLFTWSDAPDYSHREIDVEISKWGDKDNKNGQFVVQPYTQPMNIFRFQIPAGLNTSTHSFAWKRASIFCQSLRGGRGAPSATNRVIAEHTFTQGVPQAGGENARINLWLISGHPPTDGQETEIIVSKFEFVRWPK